MLLTAIIVMSGLGIVLGLSLAWGSKRFFVETDPRIDQLDEALPGVNCGACGYAGCAGYAEGIVNDNAPMNLCAPGGADCAMALAAVMGAEVDAAERKVATCACQGGLADVAYRFEYDGVEDCRAATVFGAAGGRKACTHGCLGFGTCAKACPFEAIVIGPDRLPHVDEEKCTGCNRCVTACPRSLMRVDGEGCTVFVRCESHDKGAVANKICSHACIACKKCEKECPFDAIHIENALAVIDYDKCKHCGKCVKACPKDAIVNLRKERKQRQKARKAQEAAATSTSES